MAAAKKAKNWGKGNKKTKNFKTTKGKKTAGRKKAT